MFVYAPPTLCQPWRVVVQLHSRPNEGFCGAIANCRGSWRIANYRGGWLDLEPLMTSEPLLPFVWSHVMGNQWNKGHGWVVPSSFACYKPWSLFPEGDLRYGPKRAKTTMNPPHHRSYWTIQTCNDNKQKISNMWLHERITPSHFGWGVPEVWLKQRVLLLVKFLGQNFWPKIWPKVKSRNFWPKVVHDSPKSWLDRGHKTTYW